MEGLITLQEIVGILIATVQIAPTFGTQGKILLLQSARTIKLCRCRFSFLYVLAACNSPISDSTSARVKSTIFRYITETE